MTITRLPHTQALTGTRWYGLHCAVNYTVSSIKDVTLPGGKYTVPSVNAVAVIVNGIYIYPTDVLTKGGEGYSQQVTPTPSHMQLRRNKRSTTQSLKYTNHPLFIPTNTIFIIQQSGSATISDSFPPILGATSITYSTQSLHIPNLCQITSP